MILLAALLQMAAPPVPPPPRESVEAALALWAEHPPTEVERRRAIDFALAEAATQALYSVGIQPSSNLKTTERYLGYYDRLLPRLAARVPADRAEVDRRAAECAVEALAYQFTPAEIADIRRFAATPAGTKFWVFAGNDPERLKTCYKLVLAPAASAEDYRAIGLRPPPPPPPPPFGIVY